MIFGSRRHGREVANAEAAADNDVRDVVGGMRFLRAHDQILLVVRRHSSDRGDVRALLDRRRQLVVAHAL